ncbi:hypothetical protein ACH4UT_20710 [Streptomyces sp. NPDC020799]|uniref:hypothetical protein n=1 Tax=Streptomyces sp. NPDC020799 TaxID=3365091 RepID=UPI00379F799A
MTRKFDAWDGEGGSLSAEENRVVTERWERAATARTRLDGIMTGIQQSTAESHGGKLEGLEYSLKGIDSFRRKAATAKDEGDSVTKTAKKIKDLNRYTLTFESEKYTEGVERTYEELRGQGYEPIPGSEKNTWGDPVYKGVNTSWQNPATEEKFELQFHTPESFKAKMENHELYEISRADTFEKFTGKNEELARQYQDAANYLQSKRYDNVQIPPGAERIGEPLIRDTLEPHRDPKIVEHVAQLEEERRVENAAKASPAAAQQSVNALGVDLGESLQADGPDLRSRLAPKYEPARRPNAQAPAVDPLPTQSRGRGPALA